MNCILPSPDSASACCPWRWRTAQLSKTSFSVLCNKFLWDRTCLKEDPNLNSQCRRTIINALLTARIVVGS